MNKIKNTHNIIPITENDIDTVIKFLKKYYFCDEPLNTAIGLIEQDESVNKMESFCNKCLQNGISFMAVSETGDLMGVILNGRSHRSDVNKYIVDDNSDESSKFNNIVVFFDKIQREGDIHGKYPNVDHLMHMIIVSVNEAYRGQGVCNALVAKTKEVALELGCQLIHVECSSLYTAKTAERFGFQCVYSLNYTDYVNDKGEVVFKTQPPHMCVKIYVLLL